VHELAVHVYPAAQAAFSVNVDQVTVPSQPVNMINLSSNATEYYWDFHDGTTSPLFNPSHTYQEAGIYDITLMVNNEFGCADSLTLYAAVVAKVGGSLTFPNAFTPVASGPSGGQVDALSLDNDVFFPKFEGVKDYQLLLYNKWGELLFESHDVKKGWDGYYRDQLCPQDVYIWKAVAIFNNGDNYTETGEVHLIRK
jgi:gliding motility-associated-like protein